MRHLRWILAPALLALAAGAAFAGPVAPFAGVSPFAISTIELSPTLAAIVPAGSPSDPNANSDPHATWLPAGWSYREQPGTRNDAIRYRRYGNSRSRSSVTESPAQLHFGFFDPDGSGSNSFVAGIRGGPMVDPHVQIGGAVDWVHRSEDRTVVAGDPFVQGNTVITPTRVLSRASSNLFPFQLFLQVAGDDNMSVIPYGGISGGYQVMFLSADDFATQTSFDATFAGWGWQSWLGAGIPLSGQSRLNGEVYINQSNPERDVTDAASGVAFRERVNADGVGMRFGIQWGF